jgi:hypothetical protein
MIRDASVVVTKTFDRNGHQQAYITVNDKHEHKFSHKSRVSQELSLLTPKELGERLSGGSYFFINEELVDFRDQRYRGFSHTNDAIDSLMNVIGYQTLTDRNDKSAHRFMNRTSSNNVALSKNWSTTNIELPMYGEGGVFNSRLNFHWNPFAKNVTSVFMLVRQICTNGMVASTPFCNMQIPLVNRWEEHLDMANMQLQNKIDSMMSKRIGEMSRYRASVGDILLLERHVMGRLENGEIQQNTDKLRTIASVLDPFVNLRPYYKADVFDNKSIAAQLPSHLTLFDAWNIATEVCTHYEPTQDSSDAGLQRIANAFVFDRGCSTENIRHLGNNIALSPFSSPEKAFFGDVTTI